MRRVRWFDAKWPTSLRTMAARMRTLAFTEGASDGFLLDRARENLIEARYVEKLSYEESLTDPFGREYTVPRIQYRQVQFCVRADFPGLELHDAPRSTQACITRLLEISDFSATIVPLVVDLTRWVNAFRREIGQTVMIDAVHVSDIQFEVGITGKILLKGDKDVRAALRTLTDDRPHVLNRVQLQIRDAESTSIVQLTNTAGVTVQDDETEERLEALRVSLTGARITYSG